MYSRAKLKKIRKRSDGLTVTLSMPEDAEQELRDIRKEELVVDITKYSPRRSLQANAYLWRLCTDIGRYLHKSKDDVYLMQLAKYGPYTDVIIAPEAVDALKRSYRYVDVLHEYTGGRVLVRCYIGSHLYSRAEMAVLLNGTIADAREMGIQTWDPLEVEAMIRAWKGQ